MWCTSKKRFSSKICERRRLATPLIHSVGAAFGQHFYRLSSFDRLLLRNTLSRCREIRFRRFSFTLYIGDIHQGSESSSARTREAARRLVPLTAPNRSWSTSPALPRPTRVEQRWQEFAVWIIGHDRRDANRPIQLRVSNLHDEQIPTHFAGPHRMAGNQSTFSTQWIDIKLHTIYIYSS